MARACRYLARSPSPAAVAACRMASLSKAVVLFGVPFFRPPVFFLFPSTLDNGFFPGLSGIGICAGGPGRNSGFQAVPELCDTSGSSLGNRRSGARIVRGHRLPVIHRLGKLHGTDFSVSPFGSSAVVPVQMPPCHPSLGGPRLGKQNPPADFSGRAQFCRLGFRNTISTDLARGYAARLASRSRRWITLAMALRPSLIRPISFTSMWPECSVMQTSQMIDVVERLQLLRRSRSARASM